LLSAGLSNHDEQRNGGERRDHQQLVIVDIGMICARRTITASNAARPASVKGFQNCAIAELSRVLQVL
jgi:hypothetical protein